MSLLLASVVALSLQTTPQAFGADVFQMGGCEHAGWTLDRTALGEHFNQTVAASGLSQADFEAAMAVGVQDAATQFETQGAALAGHAQAVTFLTAIRDRCDGLIVTYPGALSRSDTTESRWNRFSQAVLARYPE